MVVAQARRHPVGLRAGACRRKQNNETKVIRTQLKNSRLRLRNGAFEDLHGKAKR
jgi:hypothetical protein